MLQLIIFSIEHLPLTARSLCPIFRTKVLVSVFGRRILFAVGWAGRLGSTAALLLRHSLRRQ